jgi:branched-chain amino acid transport system substrate-binding protein
MNKKRYLSILIPTLFILLITTVIASCSPQQTSPTPGQTTTANPGQTTTPTTPVSSGEKQVAYGLVGAYTGSYAPIGGPHRDSIRNGVQYINDHGGFVVAGQTYKLNLIEYDDRNDPKRAVAGTTMLKDMYDIKIMMGPFGSQCTLAAQPVIEARHIVEVNAAAADDAARPGLRYSWSMAAPVTARALAMVPYIVNIMKAKTFAIISENEAFCTSQRNAIKTQLAKTACQLVADESYESGTVEYSTIIARVRQKNPDVLWVNAVSGNSILILKQIYQAGWKVQIVGSADIVTDPAFIACGPAMNEIIAQGGVNYWAYVGNRVPESAIKAQGTDLNLFMDIAEAYKATYGEKQMGPALSGYREASGFVEAMKKAGTVDDAEKIRDAYDGMVWQDGYQMTKALPNHRWTAYMPISVFYESSKGADNFKLLAISKHTDDYMEVWEATVISDYPTLAEIRAKRGY